MSDIDQDAPYKMATISDLTGFSPAVLRAWERRHGLLEPGRGPGGHRLYTADDLRVLLRVKEILRSGRSIGELAKMGRASLLAQPTGSAIRAAAPDPVRIPTPSAEAHDQLAQWRAQIVDAAMRLDSDQIERALDQCFARFATDTVVIEVISRAAQEIGELWSAGKCSIANEHMASGIFVYRMSRLVESSRPAHSSSPPVVVACLPDEYHQLGALVLSYMVTRNGARVSYLGAALPLEELEGAYEVLKPAAVLLSVTRSAVYKIHRLRLFETLKRNRGKFLCLVGGQGVPASDPAIESVGGHIAGPGASLQDIVAQVLEAVRHASPVALA